MAKRDYYEVLGVAKSADEKDINMRVKYFSHHRRVGGQAGDRFTSLSGANISD